MASAARSASSSTAPAPPRQTGRPALPPPPLVGVRQVVRGLRLAQPVPDLAADRERPFEITDALGTAGEHEDLAEVVPHPGLALPVPRLAGARQRDLVRGDAVGPVTAAVD